jgi:hypothetical protein
MVLVAALLSLGMVALRNARNDARAAQHLNDMKHIGLGLLNYESTFRAFPVSSIKDTAGGELSSWRANILPYMESMRGGPRFDRTTPWDSPQNAGLRGLKPWYYVADSGAEFTTKVFGIKGPGAFFDEARTQPLHADHDLIIVIEVRNSSVHWMQPGDLDYRELITLEQSGKLQLGVVDGGFSVLFLSGRAWRLRADTPRDLLLKFMAVDGANAHDAEELLGPFRR